MFYAKDVYGWYGMTLHGIPNDDAHPCYAEYDSLSSLLVGLLDPLLRSDLEHHQHETQTISLN